MKTAFELFYSKVGQHTSVGNYWKDPYHQPLYLNYSQYLPYVNNEIESTKSADFKSALTKLNMVVLIGGPDDNVITPWQSRYYFSDHIVDNLRSLVSNSIFNHWRNCLLNYLCVLYRKLY